MKATQLGFKVHGGWILLIRRKSLRELDAAFPDRLQVLRSFMCFWTHEKKTFFS